MTQALDQIRESIKDKVAIVFETEYFRNASVYKHLTDADEVTVWTTIRNPVWLQIRCRLGLPVQDKIHERLTFLGNSA